MITAQPTSTRVCVGYVNGQGEEHERCMMLDSLATEPWQLRRLAKLQLLAEATMGLVSVEQIGAIQIPDYAEQLEIIGDELDRQRSLPCNR